MKTQLGIYPNIYVSKCSGNFLQHVEEVEATTEHSTSFATSIFVLLYLFVDIFIN
jgi:hypothetical protein